MKSAVCLLIPNGRLALAISRRGNNTQWGLPGGKVDPGESNIEALQREVFEEIGLVTDPLDFEPLYCTVCPGKTADDTYWVTTYLWKGEPPPESKMKAEQGFELAWMDMAKLMSPNSSPFASYNVSVVDAYLAYAYDPAT